MKFSISLHCNHVLKILNNANIVGIDTVISPLEAAPLIEAPPNFEDISLLYRYMPFISYI